MRNAWLTVAGVLGGLGVALGAFGAHGLKGRLSPELLAVFEVGVRYHMYHAIAILIVALMLRLSPANRCLSRACGLWTIGIVIFSGSLYALALTDVRRFGAITPLGGIAFIAGWGCVAYSGVKRGSTQAPE